jgi:hypothetical protein
VTGVLLRRLAACLTIAGALGLAGALPALGQTSSPPVAPVESSPPVAAAPPVSVEAESASMFAWGDSHRDCAEWTNLCQVCLRDATGEAQCSTPGIACTPGAPICRRTVAEAAKPPVGPAPPKPAEPTPATPAPAAPK